MPKVLDLAKLRMGQVYVKEIKEAFAAVPRVSPLVLAGWDKTKVETIRGKNEH